MRGELLLDTGALVSLLDRSQTHHLKCRRAFADWTGPVVSTEAVLTEATHLLAGVQGGRAACVDFFLSGGALLVPSSTASLQRVRKLLDKYADRPMDFADATLVALAEELDCTSVFTTDRHGFFGLPNQRPEALSYPAERLSRPERSSRVGRPRNVRATRSRPPPRELARVVREPVQRVAHASCGRHCDCAPGFVEGLIHGGYVNAEVSGCHRATGTWPDSRKGLVG